MATEFEVSFDKAYQDLLRVKAEVLDIGHGLDRLNQTKPSGMVNQLKNLNFASEKFARSLRGIEEAERDIFRTEAAKAMGRQMEMIATQAATTNQKMHALKDSTHGLHSTFSQMARDKKNIQYLEFAATSYTRLNTETSKLQLQYKELNSMTGRSNLILKDRISQLKKAILAEAENGAAIARNTDALGRSRGVMAQQAAAQREMAITGQKVAWGLDVMTSSQAKDQAARQRAAASIKAYNDHLLRAAERTHMASGANKELATRLREVERLASTGAGVAVVSSAVGKVAQISPEAAKGLELLTRDEALLMKQSIDTAAAVKKQNEEMMRSVGIETAASKAADKAAQAKAKEVEMVKQLTQAQASATASTNRVNQRTTALNESLVKNAESAQRASTSMHSLDASFQKISASMARGDIAKANNSLAILSANAGKASKSVRLLSSTDADYSARQEVLTKMVELRNRSVNAAAQANMKLTSSQKQLITQLHQETMANERNAAARDLSIRKMLGLRAGYDSVTHSMRLQQQAASALRATLSGLHASIGMYTSATIVAATAAYAISAAIRDTVTTAVEFGETMSRVEAIMFSGTSAYENVAGNMQSVDTQIRSLGQSTIFTSNEVAKGMVDLGMAGLNATQAMEGLKPALDLASIGAISMSDSADIATNVLTTFKMEASQLGEVVDIMATAVTNSNTNVQQLANAITYVGPAAQAAGFSLKDTVATIELLSNAGIKASKAGTGLRRFMLNLLNPTKKGQAVIDKYNISLYNMNGETRELTEIVRQFGAALMADGVTPSERMAAIVDLVGVRAASAVSRMVSSFDQLELVRYQLDNVSGSADRMRKTIEDNLGSDWKKVISAFSEVQKQAFDPFEQSLRLLSAEATVYMQDLLLPFNDITSVKNGMQDLGDSIEYAINPLTGEQVTMAVSNATMLAYNLRDWAEAAIYMGTAIAGVKLAGFAAALAGADKGSIAAASSMATTKLRAATMGINSMSLAAKAATASTLGLGTAGKVASGSITLMAGTLHTVTWAARLAAGSITLLAKATAFVLPFAGWAYAIYAVGSSIAAMLRDSDDHLEEHEKKVEETRKKYEQLQDQIDRVQGKNSKSALLQQIQNTKEELAATAQRIKDIKFLIANTEEGPLLDKLNLELKGATEHSKQMDKALTNATQKVSQMGATEVEVGTLNAEFKAQVSLVADLTRRKEQLEKVMNSPQRREFIGEWNDINDQYDEAIKNLDTMAVKAKEAGDAARGMAAEFRAAAAAARKSAYEAAATEALTDHQRLNNLLREQVELNKKIEAIDAQGLNDKEASGYKKREELQKQQAANAKEIGELQFKNVQAVENSVRAAAQAAEEEKMNAYEMLKVEKELTELKKKRAKIWQSSEDGNSNVNTDALATADRQIAVLEARKADLLSEAERTAARGMSKATKDAEKAAKSMDERIEDMTERLFPNRAIEIKFVEDVETLKAMMAKGDLDQVGYDKAYGRILTDKQDALDSADPNSNLGRRLSEDYLGYSTDAMRLERDRSKITEQYGAGSNMETIAMQEWGKQRKDSVLGGDVPDVSSEAFGAGDMNKITKTGEDLEKWKDERLAAEEALFNERMENLAANNETEEQVIASHLERLTMLEKEHAQKKERLDQASNQVRYKDAAAMFGGMAELSAQLVGDNSRLTQGLLAFQQAASLAATIQNMAEGTSKSFAQLGPYEGAAAAAALVAQGAALISTITGVVAPEAPDTSTSSYSGAYDKGGNIPAGKYGVVGEYGPELVHGPAAVTGRRETAKMYGENKESAAPTIAPQISVTVQQQGSEEDARKQGKMISQQINNSVREVLQKEMRPNGSLDKWKRGKG